MRPSLLLKGRRFCTPLLTAFIIFFSCYIGNAQASGRGEESTVTFKGKDVPLNDLFKAIKKQTGYTVMYSLSVTQLDGKEKVTVDFNKTGIVQVMAYILKGRNLVWTIVDESILIYKEDGVKKNTGPPVGGIEKSDTVINTVLPMVMGKVTDADDKPIPGATVMVKGTREGTVTDGEGVFALTNVSVNTQLIVTSLGYKRRELQVKAKTIQVKMNVAVSDLDETLVIAYGTTTKRTSTGNIVTVSAKEIERQPVMNPLQALQGKVPGFVITQTSGYASAPFKTEIRGRTSINPNIISEPLYIVDGIPLNVLELSGANYLSGSKGFLQNGLNGPANGQSPLFSINPADIESISVLKDADATAIYGSLGANGVVLITTKKGHAETPKFDIKVYTGISKVTRFYDMLNTQQYIAMRREAFYNDSIAYGITPDPGSAPDLLVWDTTRYTDWQKFLWGGTGKSTDVQVSVEGGDKITTYRIGAGYHRQSDITTASGTDQRASIQFNFSSKSINQRFNISFTNLYSYAESSMIYLSGEVLLPPNAPPVYDSLGHLNYAGWAPANGMFSFGNLLQPYSSKTGFLNSSLKLKYNLFNGLDISTNLGYKTITTSQISLTPISSQNPARNPTGSSNFGNNNFKDWIIEPQLEYNRSISKGKLNVLIGATAEKRTADGNNIYGYGYANDNLLKSISNAPSKFASDINGQFRYAAVFGRVNYNWINKYIINFTIRRDGSSRFGSSNQFGNFGAVGAAWIFTEEDFFKKYLVWLSFGKIRGSFGATGSDNIGDYQYLTRWSAAGIPPYQGQASYVPTQHSNPNFHWEVNKKLEGAFNLGFLKDRLNVEVSWYCNRCDNQLLNYPLPNITGFPTVTANLPATVQNTGWEAIIKGGILEGQDFTWSANFNIGINRNKLVAFPNLEQSPYAGAVIIGKPLNIRRFLHYTGVDPQTGQYTFEDKNKDGQIIVNPNNPNNDLGIYDLNVKYDGGFGTEFSYKGLQVNAFFHFRNRKATSAKFNGSFPGDIFNQPLDALNHWRNPGDKSLFARLTTQGENSDFYYYSTSDGIFIDASFIRLQNLSVSYTLKESITRKIGAKSCRFFFEGQNLFYITNYDGPDPEINVFGGMPLSKTFVSGIQFNF